MARQRDRLQTGSAQAPETRCQVSGPHIGLTPVPTSHSLALSLGAMIRGSSDSCKAQRRCPTPERSQQGLRQARSHIHPV